MEYPPHLLQSPGWAEFRRQWGTQVASAGKAQFTIHPIPHLPYKICYMPRPYPGDIDWKELSKRAQEENCVFVKIEPNSPTFKAPGGYLVKPAQNMFAHASYIIDLRKSDEELLKTMHQKTRYNLNLARRKGVKVKTGHTDKMLQEFLKLFHITSARHKLFQHPDSYYKTLFEVFKKQGDAEIITGYFKGHALASMMVFFYRGTLFFPCGGSTHLYKETMPFYLVYWEAMQLGKRRGAKYFDMWNCLTPEQENPKHPWYGFHRFKKGFNGEYLSFAGSFDVIFKPKLYPLIIALNNIRWAVLKTGSALKKLVKR